MRGREELSSGISTECVRLEAVNAKTIYKCRGTKKRGERGRNTHLPDPLLSPLTRNTEITPPIKNSSSHEMLSMILRPLILTRSVELGLFFDYDSGPVVVGSSSKVKLEPESESTMVVEPVASSSRVKLEPTPVLEPTLSTPSSSVRKRKRAEEPSVSVSLSHGDGVYFGGSGGIQDPMLSSITSTTRLLLLNLLARPVRS